MVKTNDIKGLDFGIAGAELGTEGVVSVSGSCGNCHKGGADLEAFISPRTGFLTGRCRGGCGE